MSALLLTMPRGEPRVPKIYSRHGNWLRKSRKADRSAAGPSGVLSPSWDSVYLRHSFSLYLALTLLIYLHSDELGRMFFASLIRM